MARSNYKFKKRQKELARKKKKAEKKQSRLEKNTVQPDQTSIESVDEDGEPSI